MFVIVTTEGDDATSASVRPTQGEAIELAVTIVRAYSWMYPGLKESKIRNDLARNDDYDGGTWKVAILPAD